MDTDSLYLALAENNLYDCIQEDKKEVWEILRCEDCNENFVANFSGNCSRTCCEKHKRYNKREPCLFKEEFLDTEMLCLCSKTYCSYDAKSDKYKFSSKDLNKRTFEDCGVGPMVKSRRVLADPDIVTISNREFRTKDHSAATYIQTKRQSRAAFLPPKESSRGGWNPHGSLKHLKDKFVY